jgi:hypothetical protein
LALETKVGITGSTDPTSVDYQLNLKQPNLASVAKTSSFTAASGNLYQIDTTSGPVVVTLPTSVIGQQIGIKKVDSTVNTVTTSGVTSSITLKLKNEGKIFVADGSGNWVAYSGDLSLSSLDGHYLSVFNVKQYGAKGDGTTVDTTAVQAAVTACLAAGGGTVSFPPGTYPMSNVTFGNNITIAGSGVGNTILLMDPASVSGAVVCRVAPPSSTVTTTNCMVRDLTIDGNKAIWGNNSTQKGYGYYMGQSTNNLITHCAMFNVEIRNCMTYGFDVERVQEVRLINCVAHDNGYSTGTGTHINADGFTLIGDDITCISCVAYNNGVFGFRGGQSGSLWHRVNMINCEAYSNGATGIGMGADAVGGDALLDSHIIGCMSYSNTTSGIYLSTNCMNCSVIGNSSYNNGTNGIIASASSYCSIMGNTLKDNATASSGNPELYLTATTTNCSVMGNVVTSVNATHAISEQNSSTTGNIITGNQVASTSTTIVKNGATTIVSNNQGFTSTSDSSGIPTNAAAITAEVSRATAAEALLAPLVSPTFTGTPVFPSTNYSSVTPVANSATAPTAGSAATFSRSDHAHPRVIFDPTDHGLISWNYDVSLGNAASAPLATAGTLYTQKLHVPVASSVTNILCYVATVGGTLTSGQCFAALYQGGNLIGQTADQSVAWTSTGAKTMALVGGPFNVAAGDVQVVFWFNGTTGPALYRTAGNATFMNFGLSAANSRWGTADTGKTTTAPGTLATIAQAGVAYWAGIS